MARKHIVLIPHWVQETIKRNGLTLSDVLNFEKIKPLLSVQDLVGLLTLQDFTKPVFGVDYINSNLWNIWSDSISKDNQNLKKFFTDSVTQLSHDQSFHKEVNDRLFCEDARTDFHKEPFDTYDLPMTDVVAVVIYPGFFVGNANASLQQSLIEAILKVLYVYEPSHEVAKTPLFKRFLELLSGK